jgi:hypothetical protein
VAGVTERGQLAQLPAAGVHEQKRVAHAQLARLLAYLSAQQPITAPMNFGAPICFANSGSSDRAGLEAFVRAYLSPEHRDQAADGCPSAALLDEIARRPPDTRDVFTRR